MLQIVEHIDDIQQHKEQRAQAHDGKYVGKENDVRVSGDGKNSGDTVGGKNNIRKLDNANHNKQGREIELPSWFFDKEMIPHILGIHPHIFGSKTHHGMLAHIHFFFGFVAFHKHFYPCINQQSPEKIEKP